MFWVSSAGRYTEIFCGHVLWQNLALIHLRHANKQITNKNVCLVDLEPKNPS